MSSLTRLSLSEVPARGPVAAVGFVWVLSYVIAWFTPPIVGFPAAALATLAWGMVICSPESMAALRTGKPAMVAVAIAAVLSLAAVAQARWLDSLVLLAAAAVLAFGATAREQRWWSALTLAFIAAGVVNAIIAAAQIFDPSIAGVGPIAAVVSPGRAGGSLGQPNQLASLLILALVAAHARASLKQAGSEVLAMMLAMLFGAAVAWTGSRTGLLNLLLATVWIGTWRTEKKTLRALGLVALAGWVVGFGAQWAASIWGHSTLFAEARLHSGSDVSASRILVWRDAMQLIAQEPWTGTGWGQFSKAWALSPLPGRSSAPFDNVHNLPLQWAVELGVPLTVALLAALAWVFFETRQRHVDLSLHEVVIHRSATLMLAVLGLHSLLEYPLWYMYFLLPAAYLLGLRCRYASKGWAQAAASTSLSSGVAHLLQGAGVLIVLGTLFAIWDYSRILQIYSPYAGAMFTSLETRVQTGQRSILFGYLADYAAVTTPDEIPAERRTPQVFSRPLRHLVNTHLLIEYAKALQARGETDKARYVVARLREFDTPLSRQFFAECTAPPASKPSPFQCDTRPAPALNYRNFD